MQKSVKISNLLTPREEVKKLLTSDGPSRTVKYLSVESVRRLFREIPRENLRDRLLFDLIYHYGLRRTEAVRISLADFDLTADIFEVRRLKGGESKPYPLFPGDKAAPQAISQHPSRRLDAEPISKPAAHWPADICFTCRDALSPVCRSRGDPGRPGARSRAPALHCDAYD
jgi:integrase